MSQHGLKEVLRQGIVELGVEVSPAQSDQLITLLEQLLKWNQRINLVGRCEPEVAVERHLHDSLGLLRLLDLSEVASRAAHWTDVGAGAGLPGLVLAIARPNLRFTLVEPIGKKIAFARDVAHRLGLDNVEVRQDRLEALEPSQAPAVMSRATFAPERWLERGLEFVAPKGLVLVTMGGHGVREVVERACHVDHFTLPLSGAYRTNIIAQAQ